MYQQATSSQPIRQWPYAARYDRTWQDYRVTDVRDNTIIARRADYSEAFNLTVLLNSANGRQGYVQ